MEMGFGQPLMPFPLLPTNLELVDEELQSCSSSRDDEDWDSLDTAEGGPSQEREGSPCGPDSPQEVDGEISGKMFHARAPSREDSPGAQALRTFSRPAPFKADTGWVLRWPTPPQTPKDLDLGPNRDAHRLRRFTPSRAEGPDMEAISQEDSKGTLVESNLGLSGSVMDPILEDGGIVSSSSFRSRSLKRNTRAYAWVSSSSSLCDLDEGLPRSSSGPRFAGTPAQAIESLRNAGPAPESAPSSRASSPADRGAVTPKASKVPKHVACIRRQVLASRRLEELDLCPLQNARRSKAQGSGPASV